MQQGQRLHCVRFCFHVGGFPHSWNGWAIHPPKGRHALLLKVKGRRQGGDGVLEEVGGDDACEQQGECQPCMCRGWRRSHPHHLLRVGGWPLVRRTGRVRLVASTSAMTRLGAFGSSVLLAPLVLGQCRLGQRRVRSLRCQQRAMSLLGQRRFPQCCAAFRCFPAMTFIGKSCLRQHCSAICRLLVTSFCGRH
jgi:hypothetical protein